MVMQNCRGCECLILGALVGKPKIMVIQSVGNKSVYYGGHRWGNLRS